MRQDWFDTASKMMFGAGIMLVSLLIYLGISNKPTLVPSETKEKPVEQFMLRTDTDWYVLFDAITEVESNRNPQAVNRKEGAVGVAQIRMICLRDCNRIVRHERWQPNDRYSARDSYEMFRVYVRYYLQQIPQKHRTMQSASRMWVGGPVGWKKARTKPYWKKVKAILAGDGND